MNDAFELPSLEEIQEMDRQRLQAIESLEISDGRVKCQKCNAAVPLVRTSTNPSSVRIHALQKRLRSAERYSNSSRNNNAKAKVDANINVSGDVADGEGRKLDFKPTSKGSNTLIAQVRIDSTERNAVFRADYKPGISDSQLVTISRRVEEK